MSKAPDPCDDPVAQRFINNPGPDPEPIAKRAEYWQRYGTEGVKDRPAPNWAIADGTLPRFKAREAYRAQRKQETDNE